MTAPRDAWITAGFALLRAGGGAQLTIERLCAKRKLTKGAFYHHFEHIQAFRAELLEDWKRRHTQAPIDVAESVSVAQRRAALYRAVGELDQRLELAVRAWANGDPRAQAACRAVDEQRIAYLGELWLHDGKRQKLAVRLAKLEYATFLGLMARFGAEHTRHHAEYRLLVRALATVND